MEGYRRRDFLRLSGMGVMAMAVGARFPARRRPNIVFLFADDQRHDTIHALGNPHIVTPHLDSLLERGVAFTHAYIMGSMVGAVCIPSRGMLMTGRTLFHVPDDIGDFVTFPQYFGRLGYTTYAIGKWHNGRPSFARSFAGGAKIFFGGMSDQYRVPVYDFDPSGRYPKEASTITEKFSSELFTEAALEFLHGYREERPFLLYVAYTAPHDPRTAPEPYASMYDPERIPLPPNFLPQHPFDNGELRIRDELLAPFPRTPETIRRHIADYYAMISHLDSQVGRILRALEETGHAGNTLLIFAGDNGLAVGQHGLMGKQNLYEHSVHVPLILAGLDLPRGQRCDAFCYLLDLFPTLCELADLPIPETVEGQSLLPLLGGGEGRESLFFAYKNCQRAVRERRFKLIEYFVDGARHTQLFDLQEDPWETRNLAAEPAFAETLKHLRAEMVRWQEACDDPLRARDLL